MNETESRADFPGFASRSLPCLAVVTRADLDADGKPNAGISVYLEGKLTWLGWGDTVALHRWLSDLLAASRLT